MHLMHEVSIFLRGQKKILQTERESLILFSNFFFLVRLLREELQLLHEPGSYVGEIVKVMGKTKVLVKVQPEGKYSEFDIEIRLEYKV